MASHETAKAELSSAPEQIVKKGRTKKQKPTLQGVDLNRPTDASLSPAPQPIGHNSGEEVPELKELLAETLEIAETRKKLNKAERDIRNKVKIKYNIPSANWAHRVRLAKFADDVRIQFESQDHDLRNMLGYQAALDLNPGTIARTEEEYVDPSVVATSLISRNTH
jgi:hypothetical protein